MFSWKFQDALSWYLTRYFHFMTTVDMMHNSTLNEKRDINHLHPCPTPLTPVKQTPEGYRSGQRWCTRRGRATFFWPALRIGIIHNKCFPNSCAFVTWRIRFCFLFLQTFLMKFRTGRCWNLIKVDYMYQHVFGGFKPPTEGWIRTAGRALLDRLLDVHRTNRTKNVWMWAVSLLLWMVRDFVVLLGKVMVPVAVVLSVPIQHTLGCKQHPLKDADIYYDLTSTIPAMDPRACFPNGKKRSLKNFSKRMEDPKLLQVD